MLTGLNKLVNNSLTHHQLSEVWAIEVHRLTRVSKKSSKVVSFRKTKRAENVSITKKLHKTCIVKFLLKVSLTFMIFVFLKDFVIFQGRHLVFSALGVAPPPWYG